MDLDRNALISQELDKLNDTFKYISKDKKKLVAGLVQNAAFMKVTLEELQEKINNDGAIVTAVNGNGFEVCSENPAQKSYNTMINRYNSVIKQLTELLPDSKQDNVNKAGEALAEFIVKGKPKPRGSGGV